MLQIDAVLVDIVDTMEKLEGATALAWVAFAVVGFYVWIDRVNRRLWSARLARGEFDGPTYDTYFALARVWVWLMIASGTIAAVLSIVLLAATIVG